MVKVKVQKPTRRNGALRYETIQRTLPVLAMRSIIGSRLIVLSKDDNYSCRREGMLTPIEFGMSKGMRQCGAINVYVS